jgi:hypothetical protein
MTKFKQSYFIVYLVAFYTQGSRHIYCEPSLYLRNEILIYQPNVSRAHPRHPITLQSVLTAGLPELDFLQK